MLSKRFYDIITIAFIILAIGSVFLSSFSMKNTIKDSIFGDGENTSNLSSEEISERINPDKLFLGIRLIGIFQWVLALAYYIFVLVLAIQMYALKKISTLDLVLIAIFVPLAFIFYLLTVRKRFKEISGVSSEGTAPMEMKIPVETTEVPQDSESVKP
jgi:hypothetical protein